MRQKLKSFFMRNTLIVCLFFSLLFSCGKSGEKHFFESLSQVESTLNFDINKKSRIFNFDSIFKKQSIISLETNPKSIILGVNKIDFHDDKYFVFDFGNENSVSCFNKKGKFLFKLKKIGKGPHEYINYIYGSINDFTGDIELLANSGSDLMVYDSLGNFKDKMKLPYSSKSFCAIKNKRFFYKGFIENKKGEKMNFRFYSLDSDGRNIKKYLPYQVSDKPNSGAHYLHGFSKVDKNDFRFIEKFNDTVYKIGTEGMKPLYKLNFSGYNKPNDFLYNKSSNSNQLANVEKMNIPHIVNFYEFDKYITGVYEKITPRKSLYFFIFDKEQNKLIHNSSGGMIFSPEIKIYMLSLLPKFKSGNLSSTFIYSDEIDDYVNSKQWEAFENRKEIQNTISSYFEWDGEISSNPYILNFKIE